jgi:hypothetical protein
VRWQVPAAQVSPEAQAVVQFPQCRGFVWRSAQTEVVPSAQICRGALQAQAEEAQTSPARQTFPHPPQLEAEDEVFTQVPAAGGGQSATGAGSHAHAPAVQVPRPQSWPQVPQFALSVCTFTQERPHRSGCVAGHEHNPAAQVPPAGQVTLHAPQ